MSRKSCLSLVVSVITILGLLPTSLHGAASPGIGLTLTTARGTVGSAVGIIVAGFAPGDPIDILWDGRILGTLRIDPATRSGSGSFMVPAATKGIHTISGWRGGAFIASKPFEVVPRIKLIPGMAGWGQQVNVSLRGYSPRTIVRIRWLGGSAWVELTRVSTSKTGSANVYVTVPSWAPVGANSIRGDAVTIDGGRAQTNAFRADLLIYIADPIETLRPIERTPVPSSPTPDATAEPTGEATATPTATPTAESTPAGTPIALVSG